MKYNKRSDAWRLFTELDLKKVKCLVCGQILSMPNKSTFSLIRHLNSKHPDKESRRPASPETLAKLVALNENSIKQRKLKEFNHNNKVITTEVNKMDSLTTQHFAAKANPLTSTASNEVNSDSQLINILSEIDRNNYLYVFARCKEYKINARQLKYLQKDHVRELIPMKNLGVLAEFEYRFNEWKLKNGYNTIYETRHNDAIISVSTNGAQKQHKKQLQKSTSAKVRTDLFKSSPSRMTAENDFSAGCTFNYDKFDGDGVDDDDDASDGGNDNGDSYIDDDFDDDDDNIEHDNNFAERQKFKPDKSSLVIKTEVE